MGRSSGMTGDDAYAILHKKIGTGGGGSGTTNYNDLTNKPKINGFNLEGNKTSSDIGVLGSDQGSENAGKVIGINVQGKAVPMNASKISVNNHIISLTEIGGN